MIFNVNNETSVSIISSNNDYPDFTNNWRWVKYSDGTFKAEYRETINTGTLSESGAIAGLMYQTHTVALPFTPVSIDVPKWDDSGHDGVIWVSNHGGESLTSVNAMIMRAIKSTTALTLRLGCTATGRWK